MKPSEFFKLIQFLRKRILAMEAVQDMSSSCGSQSLKINVTNDKQNFCRSHNAVQSSEILNGCNAVFANNRITFHHASVLKINL